MTKKLTQKGVTLRQRRAIASLVTDGAVTSAAKAAGVSRDTIYRWLQDEHFRRELHTEELRVIEKFSHALASVTEQATMAIREALDDDNAWVRLRAASMVADGILRARETLELEQGVLDLEQRVKTLEEIIHAYNVKLH